MTGLGDQLCRCSGRDGFTRVGEDDWVCAKCHLPMPGYERQASGGLAHFRGGPMDGRTYTVESLMGQDALVLPITQYRWTHEKVTSQRTKQTARVWEWIGEQPEPPAVDDTKDKKESAVQNTTADGVTNTQLADRRKALGLSRTPVAEKAGITVSQLASMEVSGKRIKEGVMDKVHNALLHFEGEAAKQKTQPAASDADDAEGHTTG